MQPLFVVGLGAHSQAAGDEGDLPSAISFAHTFALSFANQVHDLIPLKRSPCCGPGKEAQPRLDQPFDACGGLARSG